MIKKCGKYLLTAICVFFVSLVGTSAKEVTIDELAELVKEVNPQANSVFIIGEYAFTSGHELTLQDIMLASRSIEVSADSGDKNTDPIYEQMIIDAFNGTLGSDFKLQSLTYAGSLIGPSTVKNTYDIKYVDYNKVYTKVDVDALVNSAYETIKGQVSKDKFGITKEGNNLNIVLRDLTMSSIDALMGTGVETAAINFLKENGIKSVTLKLGEEDVTIGSQLNKEEIENFFKALGKDASDLVGKTMTATVEFEDGYKTLNSDKFTINFGKQVDVDLLVKKAYETIEGQGAKDKFVVSLDKTNIEITLMDLEMNSANALIGTGVSTAISNFMNEAGIESVKVTIEGESITVGKEIDASELESFLKNFGSKAGDLVGKEITAEISFKEGFETANSDKFTVEFVDAKKVDVDSLVNSAYETIKGQEDENKFLVDFDENIRVILTDLDMTSVDAIAGTGVYTAALNFLNKEGISGVTLEIDGKPLTIGKTLNKSEIDTFLKTIGSKASDLVGKTMNVTILFEEGFKTANSSSFAVEIAKVEEVDVESLVEKAYKVVEKQAAKDKFIAKLNGTEIELMLVDLEMSSVDALIGTGVHTAALNFLKEQGIKEVTLSLNGQQVTIGEELNQTDIENFFKALGTKAGDLVGETMTAKVTLNKGYVLTDEDTFKIKFVEQNKVNVESIVKKSFDIVEKQVSKDKFVVSLNGTKIDVIMMDLEMNSLAALMGTGVQTAAETFLAQEGVKGVVLEIDGKPLTLGAVLDKAEIEAFLKSFGSKASDLVGKTINATVLFEDEYKEAVSNEFSIELKDANKVDVADLVASAYGHITSNSNNVFESAFVDETEVEVYLKDLEATSVNVLLGSGVGEAAFNLLKEEGVKEVCLVYGESFCFSESNLTAANVQAFFEKIGSKASDLVNESIGVNIIFDAGYKTSNIEGLNITFKKHAYDVVFDVDGVETPIKVEVGEKVVIPLTPEKEGYTFDKWLLNGTEYDLNAPVTGPLTLKASWNINTYKVNIVSNDTTMGTVSKDELIVDYGTKVIVTNNGVTIGDKTIVATPADKTAEYTYSFVNWSGIKEEVKTAMTITANFSKELNQYTVTFTDKNGSVLGTQIVDYGTLVGNLSVPSQNGYVFDSFANVTETDVIKGDTNVEVNYNEEIDVTSVVNTSLEKASNLIDKTIFDVEPLENDIAVVDFKQEIAVIDENGNIDWAKASQMGTFLESVADLLESLESNEAYETVIFEYKGKTLNLSTLTYDDISFSGFLSKKPSAAAVAQFMSKVAGYSGGSGSDIMYISTEKLVNGTNDTPINVIITLKEGYGNSGNGEQEVHYDLVFTDSIQ